MPKNILGETIRPDLGPQPPHNGTCPACSGEIRKNVLGEWICKDCDKQYK